MKIKCKVCKKRRPIFRNGMCIKCYNAKYYKACSVCGITKKVNASGICETCRKKQTRKIKTCVKCGENKPFAAKGMCSTCYFQVRYEQKKMKTVCKNCGLVKNINENGLCEDCNEKEIVKSIIIESEPKMETLAKETKYGNCMMCGKHRYIDKKEMCSTCYKMFYGKIIKCVECGEIKVLRAKDLCKTCYSKRKYRVS